MALKRAVFSDFCSFRRVRDRERGEIQIKLLVMIATMYKMENLLGGINGILYIPEGNISELEDIIIGTIQNKVQRKKTDKK